MRSTAINIQADYSKFTVGIFDSGRGGDYVARDMADSFKNINIVSLNDQKNIPYGLKTPQEMLKCITPFIEKFNKLKVDVIVIACNTCYVNLVDQLKQLTNIPILGYQPALDLAIAQTQTKNIITCATAGALKSLMWQKHKQTYEDDYTLIDIDCSHWVPLIEQSKLAESDLQVVIDQVVENRVDSLILGCTHYHWVRADLANLLPVGYELNFYESTEVVFSQLDRLLRVKI